MPPRTMYKNNFSENGGYTILASSLCEQSLTSKLRTGQNCSKHEPYPEKTVADSNVTLPM